MRSLGSASSLGRLGLGGMVAVPYAYNVTAANTGRLRSAIAAGQGILGIVIDSTGRGQSTGGGTAQAINAWPVIGATLLSSAGLKASCAGIFGEGGSWGLGPSPANMMTGDGRVTFQGAGGLAGNKCAGGNGFYQNSAGGWTFAPHLPVDRMAVHWRDNATGRTFSYSMDGAAAVNVPTTGVGGDFKTTVLTPALGNHSLALAWVNGGGNVQYGIDAWRSDDKLRIKNFSISGAPSSQMIDTVETLVSRLNSPAAHGCHAVIYGMGINDWRTNALGSTAATFKANAKTFLQTQQAASVDPILWIPLWDGSTSNNAPNQQIYVDALYQLADELGLPVFDIRKRIGWRSFAEAQAAGYMSDTVHPTALGYADIAAAFRDFMLRVFAT